MAGLPLAHAKEAAKVAVRNLRPDDRFGLVIFADEARTVIPLQSAANKQPFYDIIDRVTEGGSTNLTGGWMLGRDELRKAEVGTIRRLLLLSDGLLNRGIVEPAAVRQVVVAGLEQDAVRTSCLGFGPAVLRHRVSKRNCRNPAPRPRPHEKRASVQRAWRIRAVPRLPRRPNSKQPLRRRIYTPASCSTEPILFVPIVAITISVRLLARRCMGMK